MVFDVERIRKEFPMLKQTMSGKPLIYLDNAATTLKPKCVIDTISQFYEEEYATIHRAVYELSISASERYATVRRNIAKFINADSDEEIIFTRGATEALNIVASCYGKDFIREGDEILLTEMEHHSNIVPWQMLANEVGCEIKVVPINEDGSLNMIEFEKHLSSRTKICSITHASNALGTINPIKKICEMVHNVGGICVVDGAQAIAHFDIDVEDLDCDFYAFSGHKVFGPTGIGVLYGKKHLLQKMRPYHGGGDMVREVSFVKTTYQDPPIKFEAGTPMVAQVLGLGAAIEFVKTLNRHATEQHETYLYETALEEIKKIPGISLIGTSNPRVPLITFTIDKIHPLDLGTMIALKGIAIRTGTICAQPALNHFGKRSVCRISMAPYNSEQEIEQVVVTLDELTTLLTR